MKNFLKIVLLFFITMSNAQQKLTIEECYALVDKNYPLAKQNELLQQKANYETEVLNKAKLPTIGLNAQATYQSAVTQLPISLPNVTINPLNKDQYRATVDVNQLLYNGGMIDANVQLKEVQTKVQQQQVAVNLYPLKSKVNYYFMSVLLLQDQKELLLSKKNQIGEKIKEVKTAVKYGALLPSSEQTLEAELLKIDQQLIENDFQHIENIQNLASLTSTSISNNVELTRPIIDNSKNGNRPELVLFDLQQQQIDQSKTIISKSNLPKLNAFGQAGYGNPGLNMLENSFQSFYMVGLKMNWNVFDWNKTKAEKQALDIAKEVVNSEKETFELNYSMQVKEIETQINKIEKIIEIDENSITLREEILKVSDSQLKNGVITTSDYLVELTQLYDAKTNQKVHQTQLELAKVNYQIIKGL
ncbi:TolC family protein [Flavobacterium gelidilacus]|uniref:TolC family protein n=1 Tax=Flavobacterium gelidilacus TaxID=206041 RepID=UPI0004789A20|nr:TolC family protein [Flavobacterium gelidilacus]